jgi:FkbM family methyltransferase
MDSVSLSENEPDANWANRVEMTAQCPDSKKIPKVAGAGKVLSNDVGESIQLMHNGLKIHAGCYYGEWMTELISKLQGHHEPQEEAVFYEVLKHVPDNGCMLELGSFWAYYSLWFLSESPKDRRAFAVEPDPENIEAGRENAALNALNPVFIQACVGVPSKIIYHSETSGDINIDQVDVPTLFERCRFEVLDILHCDAQGVEFDVIRSCESLFRSGRIRFVLVSTHSMQICGDPLMHQKCLKQLTEYGGQILAEHDVHESFSGDGLIAAYFGHTPIKWKPPALSYNRYSKSLFRNPIYDLSKYLNNKPTPQVPPQSIKDATSDSKSIEPNFVSYAQNMEDVMLRRALGHIKNGFYIDVGANDPLGDSVTKAFYEQGWNGINIEPSPHYYKKLIADRSRDICINAAVSSSSGSAEFYDVKDMGVSTLDAELGAEYVRAGLSVEKISVPLLTLNEIVKNHKVDEIHFLKIDVEGHEQSVVESLDLTKSRPWIIVVEATITNSKISNHSKWEPLLLECRYKFVYFDGLNRFYLANEHHQLGVAFSAPPNIFDNYQSFEVFRLKEELDLLQKSLRIAEKDRADRLIVIKEAEKALAAMQLDLIQFKEQKEAPSKESSTQSLGHYWSAFKNKLRLK